jgi:hypothetical protein
VCSGFPADVVEEETEGANNFEDKVPWKVVSQGRVLGHFGPMMRNLQKLMLSHKGRQMLVFFAPSILYSFDEYAHHMNAEKNTICLGKVRMAEPSEGREE